MRFRACAHRLILFCLSVFGLCAIASSGWAQPNPDWIRVAVVREDSQVELQIYGRFTISALHTGQSLQQGRRLRQMAVRAVPEGIALGEEVLPYFGVRIQPERDAAISLNGRRLRGTLEIVRQQNLTLLVVNHVALEDYLRGVLSKEAPDYWPDEALKAIAMIARTYALYQRLTKTVGDYDVTGDVMSQDYGGKSAEKHATSRAVKVTAGWIVMYQGELFPTFYHSTCGGVTEHARVMGNFDLEPLRGGIQCSLCSGSPFFHWQRWLTKADLGWMLRNSAYGSLGSIEDIQVTKRTPSGRAEEIAISGSSRTLRLSGYDFRALWGFNRIRSLNFSITKAKEAFVVDGHGWGHGVGLCQWGAAELARRGFSAAEILAFYYPHSEVVNVRELATQSIAVRGGT